MEYIERKTLSILLYDQESNIIYKEADPNTPQIGDFLGYPNGEIYLNITETSEEFLLQNEYWILVNNAGARLYREFKKI